MRTLTMLRLPAEADAPGRLLSVASCAVFGHQVDNRRFAQDPRAPRRCPCGAHILHEDGSETRVRHTLSCFVRHHTYVKSGERDGHDEYLCTRCGHPLLFRTGSTPYAGRLGFPKRVRYFCNLFGHHVHTVAERHGFTEYACSCGHSFLRRQRALTKVTHPPICTLVGHFLRFTERRHGYAEHVCRNCGHTFGFVSPDAGRDVGRDLGRGVERDVERDVEGSAAVRTAGIPG